MASDTPSALKRYLHFAAWAIGTTVLAAGLGYFPTVRLCGYSAVGAMLAGCGASLAASLVGALPIALVRVGSPANVTLATTASMALRLLVALAACLWLALSGWFERGPLLIWVGLSYLFLLIADTLYAVRVLRQNADAPGAGNTH